MKKYNEYGEEIEIHMTANDWFWFGFWLVVIIVGLIGVLS